MSPDTGFPRSDAQTDFGRARRGRALARLAARLRREPDDIDLILPFEEVVAALGRAGERRRGLQVVDISTIVGTVDRGREFDRSFRPTSERVRPRWERIATAQRRGESLPPVDLYRIGAVHFVRDGHHRVSVARTLGHPTVDAYVTEVLTEVHAEREITVADLPRKTQERLFFERVPLPPEARERIRVADASWEYAGLAEGVEAWGFRAMQACRELMTREQVAERWYYDEFEPVIEMLREGDLIGEEPEASAYIRVATERYLILTTHEWNDRIIERLRRR